MLVFFVAVTVNIPNWFTLRIYKREDGRIRAGDTELYDSIGPYYFAYHVSLKLDLVRMRKDDTLPYCL